MYIQDISACTKHARWCMTEIFDKKSLVCCEKYVLYAHVKGLKTFSKTYYIFKSLWNENMLYIFFNAKECMHTFLGKQYIHIAKKTMHKKKRFKTISHVNKNHTFFLYTYNVENKRLSSNTTTFFQIHHWNEKLSSKYNRFLSFQIHHWKQKTFFKIQHGNKRMFFHMFWMHMRAYKMYVVHTKPFFLIPCHTNALLSSKMHHCILWCCRKQTCTRSKTCVLYNESFKAEKMCFAVNM